jgi:hypothetical protein
MSEQALNADDFDGDYQLRMVTAYPVIGGLTRDGLMFATPDVKRAAFERILANRNLRRTHELYLESLPERSGVEW